MKSRKCSRGSPEPSKKVVVLAGPTASGKSSLAVDLARRLGGEIVNADSMQVYIGMDVGTAKPTPAEQRGIPHHLLDVVRPDEDFNAAVYRSLAVPVIDRILDRGNVCFIVGGTGLYIRALLGGLLFCPPTDRKIREDLGRQFEEQGPELLHLRLAALDPEASEKIHPRDKVRVTRALEIIRLTGQPLSSLMREHRFRDRAFHPLKICLQMEREALYHRIDQRSLLMIERGLVEETGSLLGMGYSPLLKPMRSLGYRHAVQHLEGHWSLARMIGELQRDTRRYAKRQLTWFRADDEMKWRSPDELGALAREIDAFLREEG
jgi:tRNA dimethylallyltransferase